MGLLPEWVTSRWNDINQRSSRNEIGHENQPLLSEERQEVQQHEAASPSPSPTPPPPSSPPPPRPSLSPSSSHRVTRTLGRDSSKANGSQRQYDRLKSPWSSVRVKAVFITGLILLLLSVSLFLLLSLSIFAPIPNLVPLQTSPPIFPLWLFLTSILLLAPGLYLFELNSSTTRSIHHTSISLLLISMILLVSITTLRQNEVLMGLPAVGMAIASFAWCIGTSHLIDQIHVQYKVENGNADLEGNTNVDPSQPSFILASVPASKTQSKWKRYSKLFLSWLGTIAVSLTLLSLTFDLILNGVDSGLKTRSGNKVWIRSKDLLKNHAEHRRKTDAILDESKQDLGEIAFTSEFEKLVRKVPDFKLYISCEGDSKRSRASHISTGTNSNNQIPFQTNQLKRGKGRVPLPVKPTALVFTERGVAGEIGSEWVREMVRVGDNNDDGHLSLDRVCFFDRIGHGYSDYLSSPLSVPLQTAALHSALTSYGEIQSSSSDVQDLANSTSPGHFLLISTGYGSLFARHFAATYPHLVHGQLLIDSELPSTWYTSLVSSTLRAGYGAKGHGSFSMRMFYNDVLPVLLEPLSITRFLGLLATFGPKDRLLSPRQHGGARNSLKNPGGGGFRLKNGGANLNLLSTSLNERLDANQGNKSSNYLTLTSKENQKVLNDDLTARPMAILTSFWKLHLDLQGWGEEHVKHLVEPSRKRKGLIGWWRVGSREMKGRGGSDDGHAMGMCGNEVGVIWCKEAVRKILGWDLANSLDHGKDEDKVFDV